PARAQDRKPRNRATNRARGRIQGPQRSNFSLTPAQFHVTVIRAVKRQVTPSPGFCPSFASDIAFARKVNQRGAPMATATMPVQRRMQLRPKYVLFALIGLMMVYVLRLSESFLIHPGDPAWHHYHMFRCRLLRHGIAGA